jgi:hypothetical protein
VSLDVIDSRRQFPRDAKVCASLFRIKLRVPSVWRSAGQLWKGSDRQTPPQHVADQSDSLPSDLALAIARQSADVVAGIVKAGG